MNIRWQLLLVTMGGKQNLNDKKVANLKILK